MFRAEPMMRFGLVVLERDERLVLRDLAASGAVQLGRLQAGPKTAPLAPRDRATELAGCSRRLARVEELRRSLEIIPPVVAPAEPVGLPLDQAEKKILSLEERAETLLKRRQSLLQRWASLTSECEQVSRYRGLEIPLTEPDQYSFLHFVTGTLPAENLEQLQSEVAGPIALLPLPERDGRRPLIALTTRQGRAALENALRRTGFQHETLPAVESATTDTWLENNERERKDLSAALEQVHEEIRALANEWEQPLAEIEVLLKVECSLLTAEQDFPRTESAILITGWVPAGAASALAERWQAITGDRCVIETTKPDPFSEEPTPVLLRHPWWLRPFEMLVSAYGLPKYQELVPTLFLALSYLVMFGMMFGDLGHGAVLGIAGLSLFRAGRSQKLRDVGLLLWFGGLASMGFGIIYGSCFGLEFFKAYALWHDPLDGNPMTLMYGAMGVGIVMISLGLILNIINCFQRGDIIGGLLDKFGLVGVLFYWGALGLITKFAVLQSHGLVSWAIMLFLGVPLVGWAVKSPLEYFARRRASQPVAPGGGLFVAITESLVGTFEAGLSYLANTISFVRLAAYAMSHAALLVAVFIMAAEVKRCPVGGGGLSVLIVILGNLVAIVLEGIIASVQALRLEYYEFFGKFFSGRGQAFQPFRLGNFETATTQLSSWRSESCKPRPAAAQMIGGTI
jgi:V/A-type H+-transporting ATPase subunit I